MVGRTSRTNALSRYLEALPQNETEEHQDYPAQVNQDNMQPMNSYPYASNHISDGYHPPPAINSVLTDTNEIHTLSDVTSNSDLTEDQTLSLLSKEERFSNSQNASNQPSQDREKAKPFHSKFKRSTPEPNQLQQPHGMKQKFSTPSPNTWKDALRRSSKQKQQGDKDSPNTRETNSTTPQSSQEIHDTTITPSSWKNALRRKKSNSFAYQQHRDQDDHAINDEETYDQQNMKPHHVMNETNKSNNFGSSRSLYNSRSDDIIEKETDNRNQRKLAYNHLPYSNKQVSNASNKNTPRNQNTSRWKKPQLQTPAKVNLKISTSNYDNDVDHDEPQDDENSHSNSVLSVQDRIKRFSSNGNLSSTSDRQTKVDMFNEYPPERSSYKENYGNFEESYEDEDAEDDENIPMAPSPSRVPPSPQAAAAADAAAELVRRSMSTPPRKNTTSYTNFNDVSVKNHNDRQIPSKAHSSFPSAPDSNPYSNVKLKERNSTSRSRSTFESGKEKKTFVNARSTLRSHSLPRTRVSSKSSFQNPSSQSPFRFDIPDDQGRNATPNQFSQLARQTTQSTRQKAVVIQKETANAIQHVSYNNNSNASIASKTIGSSTQVSKDDIEKVMDRKLKLMEDRLAAQMNEKMEELESNMENKMDEIHALLLNLMDNRLHERRSFS